MRQPGYEAPRRKRFAQWLVETSRIWWLSLFVGPLVLVTPTIVLTILVTKPDLTTSLLASIPWLNGFSQWPISTLMLAGTFPILLKAIYGGLEKYAKPPRSLSVEDMLFVQKAIEVVVSSKANRICADVKSYGARAGVSADEVFKTITKPDQQIALLVTALHSCFEYFARKDSNRGIGIRVGLLSVKSNKPLEWISYAPIALPPRTPAEDLSAPGTTVTRALECKGLRIVSDIQKELRKSTTKETRQFVAFNTTPTDQGSQLCYAMVHPATGNVEHVLCVAADRKDSLIDRDGNLYKWLIDLFSLRIALEHSLLILKERVK